jgi:putative ABC transport system ATP-binding protein
MISLFNSSVGSQSKPVDAVISAARTFAIKITDLVFAWNDSAPAVLKIPALNIEHGRRVFIQGPSGSGKSTLLGILAGIATPQTGRVTVMGNRLDLMSGPERDRFRADHLGVIFQMFNLIPYLSIMENVTLPCRFSKRRLKQAAHNGDVRSEAMRLLSRLGLADPFMLRRPVTELSVGQQQRVAAARALLGAPEILIADEPTSSLDAAHRADFIALLFEECRKENTTLVFVSHDTSLAPLFDRSVRLTEINRADSSFAGQGRRS